MQPFNATASNIMRSVEAAQEVDLVAETLDLIKAKHEFAANLVVQRTETEMLGSLLGIKAYSPSRPCTPVNSCVLERSP